MRNYGGIHWNSSEARLKTYSAATRAKGGAVVKIELEVLDPCRLGFMLQELAEIQRDQEVHTKETAKTKTPKVAPPPRLLTYRSGE